MGSATETLGIDSEFTFTCDGNTTPGSDREDASRPDAYIHNTDVSGSSKKNNKVHHSNVFVPFEFKKNDKDVSDALSSPPSRD